MLKGKGVVHSPGDRATGVLLFFHHPLTLTVTHGGRADELERLARRDDALTGALVAYGIVAFLVAMAYCINAMLGGGGGSMLLSKSGLQGRQRRDSHQNAA